MQYSITRALSEIKLLDSRINNKINLTSFIQGQKKSAKKVNNVMTVEEFKEKAKAGCQSIVDLIERRKLIKSLIVKSNAETDVVIGSSTMKVADAIERKTSIEYDKTLLNAMIRQYNAVVADVNRRNEVMEQNLDRQLEAMMGSENKKTDGAEAFAKSYREQNSYDIIDPLKLQDEIEKLRENIEEFESNVDFALSENNARSMIEIPD